MNFQLPASLSPAATAALHYCYCAGLPDYMPWTTQVRLQDSQLQVEKEGSDSSCLCAPWFPGEKLPANSILHPKIPVVLSTATLVERPTPYQLVTELARGKINQVRNQSADWQSGGLTMTPALEKELRETSKAFALAVCQSDSSETALVKATEALAQGLAAAEALVKVYTEQVFQARRIRTPVLPTAFSCSVRTPLTEAQTTKVAAAFNAVRLPFRWKEVEAEPSKYVWDQTDALMEWAKKETWQLEGGTLIDFRHHQVPAWVENHHGDVQSLANVMVDYLENTLNRYKDVGTWNVMAGMNAAAEMLSLDEEEVLWLTAQLLTAALQIRPDGQFSITLTQPWGEPMAEGRWAYSPFVFADALLRHRVQLHSLEIELVQGVRPRGSWWRDRLDISRMLDLYALLSVPVRVQLGCPSLPGADPQADPELQAEVGDDIWTPAFQAAWAEQVGALALCKPYTIGINWCEASDGTPHSFPHCGVFDGQGNPKPALEKLTGLRSRYLR